MDIQSFFQQNKRVAVAFSGGVDSAVLLLLATRYADVVKAYYVKTPFQPAFELEDAQALADSLHVPLTVLTIELLSDKAITVNPADRCYYCKKRLFTRIRQQAAQDGLTMIIEGTNASDDIGDRPGFRALQELSITSPLRDAGYTKSCIRLLARENGLPVADKPSFACLATRIPTGTPLTAALLERTERAENVLREAGFRNFRVRYDHGNARLELGRSEMKMLMADRKRLVQLLQPYYTTITLDLKERPDE